MICFNLDKYRLTTFLGKLVMQKLQRPTKTMEFQLDKPLGQMVDFFLADIMKFQKRSLF